MSNYELPPDQIDPSDRRVTLTYSLLDTLVLEAVGYYPDEDMVLED
jgi:hypothetical protein